MSPYEAGDKVEYRPVGGQSDNVNHTFGIITKISQADDGSSRYHIRNDNTGHTTEYQEMNIVRKA